MSTLTRRQVIQRYFDGLFNEGRLELVNELLHPEYTNHSPGWPGLPTGREGVAIVVQTMRAAFPDLRYFIEEVIEQPDAVAVRTRVRGTHRGEFLSHAGTGRRFDVPQITIERFRDGRIIAHHRVTDELGLQRQLGFLD
jgi:predicted ester cyclase